MLAELGFHGCCDGSDAIRIAEVIDGRHGSSARPSLPEQSAIADFLDRETAKIDTLVAKKRALIERLKEKRTALISRTVTRGLPPDAARAAGLDPHPKLKPSGIDWLGDVPEHWTVTAAWHQFFLGRGRVISHEDISADPGDYPIYSSQTENEGVMGSISTYDFDGKYITWTTDGANAGTVFARQGRFNCTNVCGTLKAKNPARTDIKFVTYTLSLATAEFVRHDINPKLMNNVMKGIRVPFPPVEEQQAIADFLDRETAKIDRMVAKVETAIDRLREYRTALITAAVTGKIDVREALGRGEGSVSCSRIGKNAGMNRVEVKPELLRWARERAGFSVDALARRFPRLEAWERGDAHPTLKQLEGFAKATFTPIGFLFLQEPPVERVPIPDFRTVANVHVDHPSPDLLDTIYLCQQRQDWYRDFARSMGEPPLEFVGSARVGDDIVATAARIRHALGFDLDERRRLPTWTDALRRFIEQADALGVLVMVSGVVGSNNRRHLDPDEFRGFALADPLAPLVFINGADTKAAQMFTLAHELAHIWLGQSARLRRPGRDRCRIRTIERWCNQVAAELLVPLDLVRERVRPSAPSCEASLIGWRGASRSARSLSCGASTTLGR